MRRLHIPAAITVLITILFFAPLISTHYQCLSPVAFAEELWMQELMDICSKTDEAMSFSNEELKALIERGEKLKPAIEALEESPRKVYMKRLQKCISLFTFVIESKEAEKKAGQPPKE